MDGSSQQEMSIQHYLKNADTQARIRENIQRGREDATVSIGRAAQLFGFTESKLREFESIGLLNPIREGNKGQRQYSLKELDKLAVIQEMVKNGRYAAAEIPADIDTLWNTIAPARQAASDEKGTEYAPIDQRIEREQALLFWRYYASRALRMSLVLIGETLPNTTIGLLLPLHGRPANAAVPALENLPRVGEALIGWLTGGTSSQTLFTPSPSFQYPTDYCLYPLVAMQDEIPSEAPEDGTLIILERQDRRTRALSLRPPFVKLIRRLLAPLYQQPTLMKQCFGLGMRDERESATDFESGVAYQDSLLDGLVNMIINMGGRTASGSNRWRFCHLVLPDMSTASLPLQQRFLITRAQSKESPYIVGASIFSPSKSKTSVAIRAFQSGRIIYRPDLSPKDRTPVFLDIEGNIHSNIAVPIGAENGQPVAVLYVASDEVAAFPREDQQLLRIMGRFIESLLNTYAARFRVTKDLRSLMRTPEVVDTLFAEFLSENDFMRDVESLLTNLNVWLRERTKHRERATMEKTTDADDDSKGADGEVSFIALDLDNQESLASQYGDEIIRYLNRTIGLRIQDLIAPLITKSTNCQLYHIYADRFYLILRGISLEKAREKAEQFRVNLQGSIAIKRSELSDTPLILPEISVHLAVLSYSRAKLEEFLQEYSSVSEISAMISQALDVVLKLGVEEKGNVVISWDPVVGGIGGYRRWSSTEQ